MTGEIRELDAATREQIAAGEVIERPASAVKELVENALDADASRIDVAVEAGGIDAITVADDGVGMDRTAVRAAVREHTTSKIRGIDDLEAGVGTLGFRGEALHAIGAVSRTTITTKPRDDDRGEATDLLVEGGDVTDVSPAGRAPGTTVAVDDLFFNVPARRKYLKQPSTEFSHVNSVVTAYALANPNVAVSLTHDGRETFATTGQGDHRETVLAVYGREVAGAMIDVGEPASTPDPSSADDPLQAVEGLVSHPETTRAGSEYCTAFVNGRFVRSSVLRDAVVDAYGTQLAPDRYPFAVVFLATDPATVDVNVHPRKMEVRFSEPEAIRGQVRTSVEAALREEGLLRSSAPRGRSAPEQTQIDPAPAVEDADRSEAGAERDASGENATTSVAPSTPDGNASADVNGDGDTSASAAAEREQSTAPDSHRSGAGRVREPDAQTTLDGDDAAPPTEHDTLPALRVLGQADDTYVVAESDDGLVLVDQHAADERVNYERLRERLDGDATAQALATPVELELTASEMAAFDASVDALAQLGFRADRVDDSTIAVEAVPAVIAESADPTLVRDVLADVVAEDRTTSESVDTARDAVLADLACHPSITGNTSLTEGSIAALLAALDACENPWACPHGRPTMIHVDSEEIDDRFERDYPGGH